MMILLHLLHEFHVLPFFLSIFSLFLFFSVSRLPYTLLFVRAWKEKEVPHVPDDWKEWKRCRREKKRSPWGALRVREMLISQNLSAEKEDSEIDAISLQRQSREYITWRRENPLPKREASLSCLEKHGTRERSKRWKEKEIERLKIHEPLWPSSLHPWLSGCCWFR